MNKGFTIIEILIVLALILIIFSIVSQTFKPTAYFKKTRDLQRISDLKILDIALKTYLLATSSPNLGPTNKGVDEASSTIFISIPFDENDLRSRTITQGSKTYYFYQVSSSEYFKNDGNGWLPVNFKNLIYEPIFSLPHDPLSDYDKGFFYSYVFKRSSTTFEINAKLEFEDYKFGGSNDKVSSDGGDNNYILEVGNDLKLMPQNLYLSN